MLHKGQHCSCCVLCVIVYIDLQWNPINMATNGPYEFGRITGGGSNFVAGLCIVR